MGEKVLYFGSVSPHQFAGCISKMTLEDIDPSLVHLDIDTLDDLVLDGLHTGPFYGFENELPDYQMRQEFNEIFRQIVDVDPAEVVAVVFSLEDLAYIGSNNFYTVFEMHSSMFPSLGKRLIAIDHLGIPREHNGSGTYV